MMTNENAIEWIKYHINTSDYEETDELLKALKKAIKALERKNTEKKGRQKMYYVNSEDLMRLFKDYIEEYGDNLTKAEAIETLSDAIDSADYIYGEEESE